MLRQFSQKFSLCKIKAMDNFYFSIPIIQGATESFKMICFRLLEQAYQSLLATGVVNRDWEENAITEVLVNCFNENPETKRLCLTAITEKKKTVKDMMYAPSTVDNLPRIDIKLGGFCWDKNYFDRIAYYMEAKNLYGQSFKKTGHSHSTSAKAYAKRYVSTGIDHILSGYYPYNTLLLGYVLVGSIDDAMGRINQNLIKTSRKSESVYLDNMEDFPHLVLGLSRHPDGKSIEHCFLLFS